jgi:hypothetical protein
VDIGEVPQGLLQQRVVNLCMLDVCAAIYHRRMKTCPRCGHRTALSEFPRDTARPDGVQSYCTECRRGYLREQYARNAARYRASATIRNQLRRAAIRRIIREAKDQECSDCGIRYPSFVMDFDHREGFDKRFNIGRDALARCSEEALRAEIRKCDVVCANCHRIRTHTRKAKLGRQDSNLD